MSIIETFLGLALLGSEWVLWLLVLLSIVSIAVMVERFWFFKNIKIDSRQFSAELARHLQANNLQGVKDLCEAHLAPESQVVLHGLEVAHKGTKAMEETMSSFIVREKNQLDRGLVILGTLGNNAPFIGLFGTVIGIIVAFNDLSQNAAGGPSVVMAGISEALVATAVGLLVAIPAVIAYNTFQRMVKRHLVNAESTMRLVTSYSEGSNL